MKNTFKILVRKFEPFENIVQLFWNQYQQKTGCTLELEAVPLDLPELHDAILTGDFDVAHVNTDWLAQCWKEKCLENLAPYIRNSPPEGYPEGWSNSLLKLQTFDDGIAGIPFHDGPECLIYRKDLFESEEEQLSYRTKFGRDLKIPETWEEFVRIAQFFNRPEKGMYGTLFALYPDGHNNIFDFALQVWSRGGSLTDEQGNVLLYSPEAVEAMTFYRELINNPFIHPRSRELESIGACWAFAHSEVAMMVNWFGFATMCETVEGSKVKGKVNIAAVPHAEGFTDQVSLNVYYTWSVSAKSSNKQAAYDFICNNVTRVNDLLLPLLGAIGCRRSTWFHPKINEIIPYYKNMEQIHSYAKTLPRIPHWHKISTIIDKMVIEIINTQKSIPDILLYAQNQADNFIKDGK